MLVADPQRQRLLDADGVDQELLWSKRQCPGQRLVLPSIQAAGVLRLPLFGPTVVLRRLIQKTYDGDYVAISDCAVHWSYLSSGILQLAYMIFDRLSADHIAWRNSAVIRSW